MVDRPEHTEFDSLMDNKVKQGFQEASLLGENFDKSSNSTLLLDLQARKIQVTPERSSSALVGLLNQ